MREWLLGMPETDAGPKPEGLGLRYMDGGSVMSNLDHEIDEAQAARLKDEEVYGQYAGWNFCGYVWWDGEADTYRCEVWVYGKPQAVVSGSLMEIMDQVCFRYGDD